MAYKVFSNGNALNASELNTYLMNQSVISFASTTARDAALTAPVEGQLVWLEDSNKYVYYTGSAWADLISATTAPSGNAIINGAFEINQRSFTSITANNTYGFDRFKLGTAGGTSTYSAQAFTPGTAPVSGYEAANFARVVVSGQSASSDLSRLIQGVEDVRTFAGQTVTMSFWAKAASGTPYVGVTLEQLFGSGGSADTQTIATRQVITTSWARYSFTVTLPSMSGKTIGTGSSVFAEIWFSAGTGLTAYSDVGIQNNTFDIWGVQLEAGSTATAFKRNASNIQGELAACQRYYWAVASGSSQGINLAYAGTSSSMDCFLQFPVTMRTAPSLVATSGTDYYYFYRNGGNDGFNSLTISWATTRGASVGNSSEISGTAGQAGFLYTGNSSALIAFNSEL